MCHTGRAETMRNLPVSLLNTVRTLHDSSNRWVAFIDALHHHTELANIVDYSEGHEKIVIGMKCHRSRAHWIGNPAVFQIRMAQRIQPGVEMMLWWDAATMMQYQFPSRIVEEVWRRNHHCHHHSLNMAGMDQNEHKNTNDDDDNYYYSRDDIDSCTGHGFDPEIINVPVSSLFVKPSLVANGGRGVFTTQFIAKGSTIILDDCVQGLIVPIPTLQLLETARRTMVNVSDFWKVVTDGFVHGYGWSESFLARHVVVVVGMFIFEYLTYIVVCLVGRTRTIGRR